MNKTVFLEVAGDSDFAAMIFDDKYNIQNEYEKMVKENVTRKTINDEENEETFYLVIHEFGDVDENFIGFAADVWGDYDSMKAHDIFKVNSVY